MAEARTVGVAALTADLNVQAEIAEKSCGRWRLPSLVGKMFPCNEDQRGSNVSYGKGSVQRGENGY